MTFHEDTFTHPDIRGNRNQAPTDYRRYSAKQDGLFSTYSVDYELIHYRS